MSDRPNDWRSWLWPAAPVLLIYLGLLARGAAEALPAMVFSAIAALLLIAFLVSQGQRRALDRLPVLWLLGAAFLIELGCVAWSTSPWIPGGVHPVWGYSGGSPAATIDRSRTLEELVKLMGLAAIFLMGAMAGGNEQDARRVRLLLLVGGALLCLWAFLELREPEGRMGNRLSAGLPSPNIAGTVIAFLILIALPFLRGPGSSRRQTKLEQNVLRLAPLLGLLLLYATTLLLTASRGAMISLLVALVVYFGLELFSGRLSWRGAALAVAGTLLGGAVMLVVKGGVAIERLNSAVSDPSLSGRGPMFATHWRAFLTSPLFGYGLGSFDAVNKMLLNSQNYADLWTTRAVHNVYLQWLEEGGLAVAVPSFLCVGAVLTAVMLKFDQGSRSRAYCALLAGDVLFLIHGASDFSLQVPAVAALWALSLGLQLGLVSAPSQRSVRGRSRSVRRSAVDRANDRNHAEADRTPQPQG